MRYGHCFCDHFDHHIYSFVCGGRFEQIVLYLLFMCEVNVKCKYC